MLGAEIHPGMNCQLWVIIGSATGGGDGSVCGMLEGCGGRMDSVFLFFVFF